MKLYSLDMDRSGYWAYYEDGNGQGLAMYRYYNCRTERNLISSWGSQDWCNFFQLGVL